MSAGPEMLIRFQSDHDIESSGWTLEYRGVRISNDNEDDEQLALIIALSTALPVLCLLAVACALLAAFVYIQHTRSRTRQLIKLKPPNYMAIVYRRPDDDAYNALVKSVRLNEKKRKALEKFLLNSHVAQAIADVLIDGPQMTEVATAMVRIYQANNKAIKLIQRLIFHQLDKEDDRGTLLREESLGLRAFQVFSRTIGVVYLWETLAYPLTQLDRLHQDREEPSTPSSSSGSRSAEFAHFLGKPSLELDPSKMEEGEDETINKLHLELLLQKLFSRVMASLPRFPLYLRSLLRQLYKDIRYQYPDQVHTVFGNLVFLRFLCPALTVPHIYGILKEPPHPTAHRTLILIAKTFQNLANKVEFGEKEPFMVYMNDFLRRNTHKVDNFFEELSKPVAKPTFGDPATSVVPRFFRKHALMVMMAFIRENHERIRAELKECPPNEVKGSLERLDYLLSEHDNDNVSDSEDQDASQEESRSLLSNRTESESESDHLK